jgi:hypothetical protein
MEADDKSTASAATPVRRPRRLWLWFAGGFLLVFAGMLLLVHKTDVRRMRPRPSGQEVRYPLWQYYADDIPMAAALGPEDSSALRETALFHLLFSAAGGGAGAAVGWCVGRLRSRPDPALDRGDIK